jgi:transcriptional regulator NrdR family protein
MHRRKSMRCPECETKVFEVLETRTRKRDGTIVRRKECGNGHRFTTQEKIVVSKPKATGDSERVSLSTMWNTRRDSGSSPLKPTH